MKFGLFIQDFASDYSNNIVQGVKQYCVEHDIQLFIFTIRSKNWENGVFDYQHFACKFLATKENIDGLVLVTNTYCQHLPAEKHFDAIKELTYIPVVSFGKEVQGISSVNSFVKDEFRKLFIHLEKDHNCKKIYFMMPESTSKDIIDRFDVYKEFMEERGQTYQDKIIYANYIFTNAKLALETLGISKDNLPFDALVCCNDSMAFGCIDYLKNHGIRVPEDVKVTGLDNQFMCDYSVPTLTSVDLRVKDQCYKTAQILHEEVLNPDQKKNNYYVDAKLFLRGSCGCKIPSKAASNPFSEGNLVRLKDQVYDYQYFLQDLHLTVEVEKFKSLTIQYYKKFGIDSCICCIYDKPKVMQKNEDFIVPEKARVFFAYNDEKIFNYAEDYMLNPRKQLYPDDFSFKKGNEVVVMSLFSHEFQYGYILYSPGAFTYNVYELIIATTGISLASNIIFNRKVQETENLSTEKKNLEIKTYFDEMTGVLNRGGFFNYAETALKQSLEQGRDGGVLFVDMDHLKIINDKYGHEAGDRAIKGCVEILKTVFRSQDLIARLGGDEFVILACGLGPHGFENLKLRLEAAEKKFNETSSEPFEVSISIGYVEFNKENNDINQLMKQADKNQYEEKVRHHKNRC